MIKLSIKEQEFTDTDTDECAICGEKVIDSGIDIGLFMADSWDPVCWDCGDWLAPNLVRILRLMSGEDSQEMDEYKLMKLESYAGKKLVVFDRFDAFKDVSQTPVDPNDKFSDEMIGDQDGDFLNHDGTEELVSECGAVRILVSHGTKPNDAIRLINKLLEMIKTKTKEMNLRDKTPHKSAPTDESTK
jgi:hypothetical protein